MGDIICPQRVTGILQQEMTILEDVAWKDFIRLKLSDPESDAASRLLATDTDNVRETRTVSLGANVMCVFLVPLPNDVKEMNVLYTTIDANFAPANKQVPLPMIVWRADGKNIECFMASPCSWVASNVVEF